MSEQEIRQYLLKYVQHEMTELHEENMPGYNHQMSARFQKKMKRILWSEKYFGKRLYLGYAVRKLAIVAIVIICLSAGNEVSARVFGFNPWEYIVTYLSENKMENKRYLFPQKEKTDESPQSVRDVPRNIPENLVETISENNTDAGTIYKQWSSDNTYLQYYRILLTRNTSISTDAEYNEKEKVTICGYDATLYTKDSEKWIVWNDSKYWYQITVADISNSKELLVKMAEDIYQE
jgi:hypothetical protein